MILYKCFLCVCFVIILVYCDTVWGRREKREKESCRQPDTVQNAVLTSKYVNEKSFKDGDIVMYLCDIGYTIEGRSRERTCNDGKWSAVRFTCSLIRCPYVPTPEHGRRIDANNAAGDYTEFTCDIGYKIKGRSKLLCRTDGNWLPSTPPICDPILCPNLQNIRNGRLFQDTSDGLRNNYQSVTEYSCDIGYYINAKTDTKVYRRECQADGTWSNREPTCDVPKCEDINDFWGGQVVFFGDKKLYSQVYYICNDSYTIFPKDVAYSECERTLQWKPRQPECLKKATKEVPKNGYSPERKTELLHTESYRVFCRRDYEFYSDGYLEGIHQMTITNNNGTLEPKVPECREARCDPTQQRNAFVQYSIGSDFTTKITSRTEVFLSCHKGYKYYNNGIEMESPLTRTCVKGKIEDAPTCEEERCDSSEQNHAIVKYTNGLDVKTKIYSGTEVFLSCQKGYKYYVGDEVMKTPLRRTCVKGQIERAPTCEEERCDPTKQRHAIVKYTNGLDVTTKIISGTEVLLSCQQGYTFKKGVKEINSPTRKTCIKGIIEGAPKCEEKSCEAPSVTHANLKSASGHIFDHNEKVTYSCENGFHFNNTSPIVRTFETVCNLGNWSKTIPRECEPDPCSLTLYDGTLFEVNSQLLIKDDEIKQTFENGTELQIECQNGYKMKDMKTKEEVKNSHRYSFCLLGKWTHEYECIPESCEAPRVINAKMNAETGHVFKHKEKVTYICANGFHFNNTSPIARKFETVCILGNWTKTIPRKCKPDPCSLTLYDGTLFWVNSQLLTKDDGIEQTFKHGTKLLIKCDLGYKMKNVKSKRDVKDTKKNITCMHGHWKREFKCIPESCLAPIVKHAQLQDNTRREFEHTKQVAYICDKGYHFYQNASQTVTNVTAICNFGNLTKSIPLQCEPDKCRLDLRNGSRYYLENNDTDAEITVAGLVNHTAKIRLNCSEKFDVFSVSQKRILKDKDYVPVVKCNQGKWLNIHLCKKRCVLFNITDGSFRKDGVNLTSGDTISHGESVILKCYNEFDNDLDMDCDDGKWQNERQCSDSKHRTTTMSSTEAISIESTTVDISYQTTSDYEYYEEDLNGHEHNEQINGCKLSKDQRFHYFDSSNAEVEPGSTIPDSTTLTVTCATIDFYDLLGDYYDYDTNVAQDPTVTCTGNKLSQLDLKCPEVALETCKELKNGTVKMDFIGFYYVSCDKGFSLNIYTDNPKCTCINGKLWYGKLEPVCTPVPCEVPKDGFDERLTLKNDKQISLSGGSTVKHGDYVYFDCTKAFQQIYEPSYRRFKCVRGNWTEADADDVNWKLGNGGAFPTCREAICEPNCINDGICYKDNKCRCPELTKGDRCETFICDAECLNNGGDCIGPGECKCQVGRSGPNCEHEGCVLPENAAKFNGARTIFGEGEMVNSFTCDSGFVLSSHKGMTCLHGLWSDIVICQKAVYYLISVKTGSGWNDGTDANVYVTLHGLDGATERIRFYGSFESGYLDEIRIQAKDIRPIKSVEIGHDGSGALPGWFVKYASIYVENMEEYYAFPYNGWVIENNDVEIQRAGCNSSFDKGYISFDKGHFWSPKWKNIGNEYLYMKGNAVSSLRGCKQACAINWKKCVAISYNRTKRQCTGFGVDQAYYFDDFSTRKTWEAPVYLRRCERYI